MDKSPARAKVALNKTFSLLFVFNQIFKNLLFDFDQERSLILKLNQVLNF